MSDWKEEARDAWDAPSWHEAAVASVKENSHPDPTPDNRSSIGNGKSPPRKNWSDRAFSAAELQTQTFPPLKFIVPELVPEGATLLVSRPKLGKSWLVLDIAIAVASGRFTLGSMKPIQGDVLYLALEDGPRRLQRRLTKLLPTFGEKWPPRLKFATECPKADQGGLNDIEQWISTVEAPRLVIVDTLAQFRKAPNGKAQVYTEDYGAIAELQKLASKYGIGIVIVHHDRKMDADDVFDTVSGSLGLTGAADTILVMKRQASAVTLHVRGRDIEDAEKALQFDKPSCRWTILGEAADINRSAERGRVIAALKEAGGPLQAKDIWIAAELRNRNATDLLLGKMVRDGEIVRADRGHYALPDTDAGQIGQKERSETQDSDFGEETDNLSNLSDLSADRNAPALRLPRNPGKAMGANGQPTVYRPDPGPLVRAPALGPVGDSLDDLEPPFGGSAV
jgi:hypothetical protein